jgi:hypothetical protein
MVLCVCVGVRAHALMHVCACIPVCVCVCLPVFGRVGEATLMMCHSNKLATVACFVILHSVGNYVKLQTNTLVMLTVTRM